MPEAKFVVPIDPSQADYYSPNAIDGTLQGDRISVFDGGVLQGSVQFPQIDGDLGGIDTTPNVLTASLPAVTQGSQYECQLAASGGTGPYSFQVTNDGDPLPSGLSLSLGGLISGTVVEDPTTVSVVIEATDANGLTGKTSLVMTIVPQIFSFHAEAIPAAVSGLPYSVQLVTAAGDDTSVTWSVLAGSALPTGLTIGASTGLISGTCTAAPGSGDGPGGAYRAIIHAVQSGSGVAVEATVDIHVTKGPDSRNLFIRSMTTVTSPQTEGSMAIPPMDPYASGVSFALAFLATAGTPVLTVDIKYSPDDDVYTTIATLASNGAHHAVVPYSAIGGTPVEGFLTVTCTMTGVGGAGVVAVAIASQPTADWTGGE